MAEKMPARLRKRHDEATRAAIKTTQLINRLQDYALNDDIEVDPGRVRAIEILLRKTLPDQKAIEHTGEVNTLLTVAQQIEQASKAIEHEPLRIVNASGDD